MEPEGLDGGAGGGDDPSDAELVERSIAGDREAFGRLYEAHARRVAARIAAAGVREGVEDLLQEAFVRAWRSLRSLRDPGAFGSWVAVIAANLARDLLAEGKAAGERGRREGPRGSDEPDPARVVEVADAVEALPEEMRTVLELRFRRGLGYAEIASELGITEDNVAVRLHRARARLRDMLGES